MSSVQEVNVTRETLAKMMAGMSRCVRRQVGAVLYVPGAPELYVGYNHIRGPLQCDEGGCEHGKKSYEDKPAFTDYSDCPAIHAEEAAVMSLLERVETTYILHWGIMYVTCEPCPRCREMLDSHGIVDVRIVT